MANLYGLPMSKVPYVLLIVLCVCFSSQCSGKKAGTL